jgi:proteasome beta subunit
VTGLAEPYFTPGNSFWEFLRAQAPQMLPPAPEAPPGADWTRATTIVALKYRDGVVMAGDRRATQGSQIASSEMEKVFPADSMTAIGLAGVAGLAAQLVRLYQLELEHYEKIEGAPLSLSGKANRLASMLRSEMDMALRGLVVLPLLAGWEGSGRVFSFDVTGGAYEERLFAAIGSGGVFAKGSLKKLHQPAATARAATRTALRALIDAAEDDSGTGGVDRARDIYPVVARVDSKGYRRLEDAELAKILEAGR